MSHNGDIALRLARAGLHVFPVRIALEGGKPQKRPRTKWRHGGSGQCSTTDEDIIRRWWWRLWQLDMVGIDLGKAGLLVLDGDRHADEHGEVHHDGVEALRDLFRGHTLKNHPVTWTASGGIHVYFKAPPDFGNGRGDLPPGIDVRGDGGLIIAPGTIRPDNGKRYTADEGHPDLAEAFAAGMIPVLPAFVQEIIKPPRAPAVPIVITAQQHGGRRGECFAAAALGGLARELSAKPPESGRNESLNAAAFRLGRMVARDWIDRGEVEKVLYRAANSCGLVKDTGAKSVRDTIKSGLDAGIQQPHSDLQDRPRKNAA